MSSTAPPASAGPRRAAVLGKPIAHSKSPQLHLAAYRALGLHDWTYERIECDADQLPGVVGGFGPEWVGVSVTMPGKFAALRFADERTERARRVGSANTLVRTATGWRADNTDIDGVAGALGAASGWALVCGSGGTAPAAVAGLAQLGVAGITVVARNPDKAARLVRLGDELGVPTRFCALDGAGLADEVAAAEVLVSTLPAEVAERYAGTLARVGVLLDAVYDPWPTPLAAAVSAAGGRVISGMQMLLHQAFAQVEQFTGLPAPREAMTCAAADAD
ncbi:shikimate dehydrogenase [Mycobacterium avium subsp. hominissuis]|uniref:Shikimate dehydrogenase n=2 Tax=Mycobacterium avium complex (MAC) TaxID=120793 RepID=A0AAW5RYJ7_MYCBC|nr:MULTISPECIES: shikimate dehydrogenase [Mycobacterium avium complex (MAC)]ETA94064.1 shikimate 5-dehydrogenase [Mycobacterium avium 05-4293]MBZ4513375.1 shikimate dehydrogenase [Mycobacterium avium subsp. hominissuis]MBZ4520406.1 shikimate dehydrogenase [Mycobacterium avium subsp. hominissuis]MBZ4531012.1 shikimate dehydrogenase [Mycobacterium avium subsp. hominissuis]MBZ4549343.1 shikimate dehydrogenase [Mycobacterium avium subsp. hominissuis]